MFWEFGFSFNNSDVSNRCRFYLFRFLSLMSVFTHNFSLEERNYVKKTTDV